MWKLSMSQCCVQKGLGETQYFETCEKFVHTSSSDMKDNLKAKRNDFNCAKGTSPSNQTGQDSKWEEDRLQPGYDEQVMKGNAWQW